MKAAISSCAPRPTMARPSAEDFAALVTDNADYLLCGPAGFMKAAAEALMAAGVLSARIRTEKFGTASRSSDGQSANSRESSPPNY